jgi:hypothetical protein
LACNARESEASGGGSYEESDSDFGGLALLGACGAVISYDDGPNQGARFVTNLE